MDNHPYNTNISDIALAIDGSHVLYYAVSPFWGRVYCSRDGGLTWIEYTETKRHKTDPYVKDAPRVGPDEHSNQRGFASVHIDIARRRVWIGSMFYGLWSAPLYSRDWTQASLPEEPILHIEQAPSGRLYALGAHTLYASDPPHAAWLALYKPDQRDDYRRMNSVRISSHDERELWLGSRGNRCYYVSRDSGTTWRTELVEVPDVVTVDTFVFHPEDVATIYMGTHGRGVCKTNDGGKTWHEANEGIARDSRPAPGYYLADTLIMDPFDPDKLYVGGNNRGWYTEDGAATWQAMGEMAGLDRAEKGCREVRALVADPLRPGFLLAGTNAGIFRSEDAGRQWVPVGNP